MRLMRSLNMTVLSGMGEGVMGYVRANEGVTGDGARPPAPRLMDDVRRWRRIKHYSLRTKQACTGWIRRFMLANGKRHVIIIRSPRAMPDPLADCEA